MRANKGKDSKGEDMPIDTELVPEADDGREDDLFCLGDLLNIMQALQDCMDEEGTVAAWFAAKAGEPKS